MAFKTLFRKAALVVAAAGMFGAVGSAQAVPVALELSLVIDVSGSIDSTEYARQVQGYKNAFLDATVQNNILSFAGAGGIAVNVIQFGNNSASVAGLGWTQLTTVGQINTFAGLIGAMARNNALSSATDVEDGILAGIASFANGFEGARKVIDVSGDGLQNSDPACSQTPASNCAAVQAARDAAAAAGITINGLAIEGDFGANGVTTWYNQNVKTADGFVFTASSFDDFERAAIAKIGREIIEVPEPGTLALLGLALTGLGFARRRQVARAV